MEFTFKMHQILHQNTPIVRNSALSTTFTSKELNCFISFGFSYERVCVHKGLLRYSFFSLRFGIILSPSLFFKMHQNMHQNAPTILNTFKR